MKSLLTLLVASLAVPTSLVWADAPTCQNVEYSAAVVEALPDVRTLCTRVEARDGQEFAVVRAEVTRVHRKNALEVRFKLPDGSRTPARYFETAPDRRVLVQGKPMRVQDLVEGQELTAYIHVRSPVIATEPVTKGDPLEPLPLETEPPLAP